MATAAGDSINTTDQGSHSRSRSHTGLGLTSTHQSPLSTSQSIDVAPNVAGSSGRGRTILTFTRYPGPDVGYPFRAIHDYDADDTTPDQISITKGTEGKVLGQISAGWTEVGIKQSDVAGWVPSSYIEVNRGRKVGDIRIQHDLARVTTTSTDFSTLEISPKDSLDKAIIALVAGFKEKMSEFAFISDNIRKILTDDAKRLKFIHDLTDALSPSYRRLMTKPGVTLEDFRKDARKVDSSETRTGIYLRITSDFKDKVSRLPELYVGMTQDSYTSRFGGHVIDANRVEPVQNLASASAQDSTRMEMYAIAPIEDAENEELLLAEQIMILINATYRPNFYEEGMEDEFAEANENPTEVLREIVKITSHKEKALALNSLADTIFSQSDVNFIPLRLRKGIKAGKGLNHSSPIGENYERSEKTLWIKVEKPGVKEAYYRSGLPLSYLSANTYRTPIMFLDRVTGQRAEINIQFVKADPHPPVGTLLYAVWEISLTGPHHTPWARLNGIGLPVDWHIANTLALRVEWQEGNEWKYIYQQAEQVLRFCPTDDQGALQNYAVAMGTIRFLSQVRQHNPRSWFYDHGTARLKSLTFDYFTQTVHLKEVAPPGRPWKRPQFKTEAQIRSEMVAAGCLNVGGAWQVRAWRDGVAKVVAGQGNYLSNQTKSCDACYIAARYRGDVEVQSHHRFKCERHVDGNTETDTCENCYRRGLLCSWTHRVDMTSEMRKALGVVPLAPRVVRTIRQTILTIGEEAEVEDEAADDMQ